MPFRPTSRDARRAPTSVLPAVVGLVIVATLAGCAIRDTAAETDAASTAAPRAVPTTAATSTPAATAEAAPAETTPDAASEADVTALTVEPLSSSVDAQISYALAYWSDYNDGYGVVTDNDCVNFTSQSLLERGWVEDDTWYYDADNIYSSSAAWVSSTAFRDYLQSRSDTVALDDTQRDQVAVGDIVQFDWDNSGDRDHTGIVTRVETAADGTIQISFAGHTTDSDFRSVDDAITIDHPGGTVYYFHITS